MSSQPRSSTESESVMSKPEVVDLTHVLGGTSTALPLPSFPRPRPIEPILPRPLPLPTFPLPKPIPLGPFYPQSGGGHA